MAGNHYCVVCYFICGIRHCNEPPANIFLYRCFAKFTSFQLPLPKLEPGYGQGFIYDFFTGAPYQVPQGMGNPIGANMAAGLVEAGENAWWLDYNDGAKRIASLEGMPSMQFPQMPEEILKKSPMSLWNVSLEVHTGRIFEHLVGPFYILYVPLAGLCLIMVLVSVFFVWWKAHRKSKQKNS